MTDQARVARNKPIIWPKPLRAYQKETIRFAVGRAGAIIADDMGLGKTVSAGVVIELMSPSPRAILVICPKNAVYTWKEMISEWLCPTVYSGDERGAWLGTDWFGRRVRFCHIGPGDVVGRQVLA